MQLNRVTSWQHACWPGMSPSNFFLSSSVPFPLRHPEKLSGCFVFTIRKAHGHTPSPPGRKNSRGETPPPLARFTKHPPPVSEFFLFAGDGAKQRKNRPINRLLPPTRIHPAALSVNNGQFFYAPLTQGFIECPDDGSFQAAEFVEYRRMGCAHPGVLSRDGL